MESNVARATKVSRLTTRDAQTGRCRKPGTVRSTDENTSTRCANDENARSEARAVVLFHFSEDPTIHEFGPHVPRTNPSHPPTVWAIDEDHAPLHWFPRECPRVTAWPRNRDEQAAFRDPFVTEATRLHAIELDWLERMRSTQVYRYAFDAAAFDPCADARGQWICTHAVEPLTVEPVGDLLAAHAHDAIELRLVLSLRPLSDLAVCGPWDFSLVGMANAALSVSGDLPLWRVGQMSDG